MYRFFPPAIATDASPFTSNTPLTEATGEAGASRRHRSSVFVHQSVASFSSHVVPNAFHVLGPDPVPPRRLRHLRR